MKYLIIISLLLSGCSKSLPVGACFYFFNNSIHPGGSINKVTKLRKFGFDYASYNICGFQDGFYSEYTPQYEVDCPEDPSPVNCDAN